MNLVALVLLVLIFLGTIPIWPHSRDFGYAPSGGLGLVIGVLLLLFYLGYIPQY